MEYKKNSIGDMFRRIYGDPLLKNSAYLIVTSLISMILGFFFWMVATRYYTPKDVGMISAILSSMSIISMVSLIGLPTALTLYLPMHDKNANKIINSCLIMGVVISIIISLIFILGLDIFAPTLKSLLGNLELIVIFIITTMAMTTSALMAGIFTAGKKSSFNMVKENVFGLTKMLFLILFAGFGATGIFLSWSVGSIISIIIGFFLLFKLWRYYPIFTIDPIVRSMASFSIGNYIASLFYSIPRFIFPIVIIDLISAESAGYFFIAMTMAGLLYGISTSMAGPFLVESSDEKKLWNNVNKTIKFSMGLLIPGLLVFIVFGKFILNIFNPSYAENSFTTLIILSVTSIPLSLVMIFNIIKNAQKEVMVTIKVNGIVTAITIILSIPFMKTWNIEGAALAYLIANTIMATVIIFKVKNPIEFISRLTKTDIQRYKKGDKKGEQDKEKGYKEGEEDKEKGKEDKEGDANVISI